MAGKTLKEALDKSGIPFEAVELTPENYKRVKSKDDVSWILQDLTTNTIYYSNKSVPEVSESD